MNTSETLKFVLNGIFNLHPRLFSADVLTTTPPRQPR